MKWLKVTRNCFDDDGDVGDSDGNDVGDLSRTLDVTKIVKKPLPVNFFQIEILKLVVDTNVSVPTMFLFLCVQVYSVLWSRGGTSPGSYLKARAQIQVQSKKGKIRNIIR